MSEPEIKIGISGDDPRHSHYQQQRGNFKRARETHHDQGHHERANFGRRDYQHRVGTGPQSTRLRTEAARTCEFSPCPGQSREDCRPRFSSFTPARARYSRRSSYNTTKFSSNLARMTVGFWFCGKMLLSRFVDQGQS